MEDKKARGWDQMEVVSRSSKPAKAAAPLG